jgi:hypothetical protein
MLAQLLLNLKQSSVGKVVQWPLFTHVQQTADGYQKGQCISWLVRTADEQNCPHLSNNQTKSKT